MKKIRTYCYLDPDQRQFVEDLAAYLGGDSLSNVIGVAVNVLHHHTMWEYGNPLGERLAKEAGANITDADILELMELQGRLHERVFGKPKT